MSTPKITLTDGVQPVGPIPAMRTELEARAEGHTPTPWVLGGCSGRMITTPDGYVGDGFVADVDTKANASFIVLAANSYDLMRSALKAAKAHIIDDKNCYGGRPDQADTKTIELIDAALRIARGEP